MSDLIKRFAVWKACNGRCFWCQELVLFKNAHRDHFLPRQAAEKLGGIEKLREFYGLPESFEIECFDNWVLSCSSCNQRKNDALVTPSPNTGLLLGVVRMNAYLAEETYKVFKADRKKAPILTKLESALEAGDIQREEIEELLKNLPAITRRSFEFPEQVIPISPGWAIVDQNGHFGVARL